MIASVYGYRVMVKSVALLVVCMEDGLSQIQSHVNKSQGMTFSAGANITGLNHTLLQLIAQLLL